MPSRLIIVANRLPVTVSKQEKRLVFHSSAGGLATGLGSFYRQKNGLWLGWPGLSSESARGYEEEIRERLAQESCRPIFLTKRQVEYYYYGFSNRILWPLFHYFLQYVNFEKRFWDSYRQVNRLFCEAVLNEATEEDIIWVHDYQLLLLPGLLRRHLPRATIGFFLHIPFPSFEIIRTLPWREEILEGMLGADLIGFHTYDYARHFLSCVRRILGKDHSLGLVHVSNRVAKVDTFPMGIDYERFAGSPELKEVQAEIRRLRRRIGDRKVILSVDRLDYTKGIPQRLAAFDLFLERYPRYREKVILVLVGVPSRTKVEHYIQLKREVDELIGRINGRHGTLGWTPIWYLYRSLSFPTLVALYHLAEVALVTPLRDGMNLIAKEFVATKTTDRGVLILSEMAGAAREMGEAIIVNPFNIQEVANSLALALEMDEDEQADRLRRLKERLRRYDIYRWTGEFMDRLNHLQEMQHQREARKLSPETRKNLIQDYLKAKERLFFLDYDGTLVSFSGRPELAKPDGELKKILAELADKNNRVVIISGRDRQTMETWLGDLPIDLVAEHGVWFKEGGGEWEMIEPLKQDWKETIRPILELYMDRTPGSLIEEKEFSLVWHYRMSDPELGSLRARELKDALVNLTENFNLMVLEGNKVIEVKPANINKGRAALRWLVPRAWDFILAMGDDWTDEDLFDVLPDWAYSIKIGLEPSRARFNLESSREARRLLKELAHAQ